MDMHETYILPMQRAHAEAIARWRYDGAYAFYDHREDQVEGLLDGTHHACLTPGGELIGYYCFGPDARIPTVEENVYEGEWLDVGLGLEPMLCGRGFGQAFMEWGLQFAQETQGAKAFRLSVAAFNERAVKVYQRAGFVTAREVTNAFFKNKFYIMTRPAVVGR